MFNLNNILLQITHTSPGLSLILLPKNKDNEGLKVILLIYGLAALFVLNALLLDKCF